MKAFVAFALSLFLINAVSAGEVSRKLKCDTADLPPVRDALLTLRSNGYLTLDEVQVHEDAAVQGRKNMNLTLKTIGLKKIGSIPFYENLVPPYDPPDPSYPLMPFDSQRLGDDLYQMVQYMRLKNAAGKVFEFVVISSVANHDCDISTPLVIQTSPQYRVVGKWEDYLQTWERLKSKGKEITPNLVKEK